LRIRFVSESEPTGPSLLCTCFSPDFGDSVPEANLKGYNFRYLPKRIDSRSSPQRFHFDDFSVDLSARAIQRFGGERIEVGSRNLDVLLYLIEHRDRLVENRELYEACWVGRWDAAATNSLDRAISDLRAALGDSKESQHVLRRERGRGVQFVAELMPVAEPVVKRQRLTLVVGLSFGLALVAAVTVFFARSSERRLRVDSIRTVTATNVGKRVPVVFDGSSAYFSRRSMSHHSIVRKRLAGGNEEIFTTDVPEPYVAAISPDRSRLLVREVVGSFDNEDSPLWIQPTNGSTAYRLNGTRGIDGVWLPDGSGLIICRGSGLFSYSFSESRETLLATTNGSNWWPRVSPRGDLVRFTVQKSDGVSELWETNLRSRQSRPLFAKNSGQPWRSGECGTWSTNGDYFVFDGPPAQTASPRDRALWAWNNRDSDPPYLLITTPAVLRGASPTSVANEFWIRTESSGIDLFAVDDEGRDSDSPWLRLQSQFETAAFSRDGRRAAYTSEAPADELWIDSVNNGWHRQLTTSPSQAAFPEWSPDDAKIAVARRELGKGWLLEVFDVATQHSQKIDTTGVSAFHPTWMSNHELAYTSIPAQETKSLARNVFVIDIDSGAKRIFPNTENMYRASVSPDLRRFSALHYPENTLWIYDLGGASERARIADEVSASTWSLDSAAIIFLQRDSAGGLALRHLDISGGKLRTIRVFAPGTGISDRWIGVAPDNRIILTRGLTRQQFVAFSVIP
jgi:Tol biopolymer transport system component/DNA-binding winged helix-turn-helix (wHTH) protein